MPNWYTINHPTTLHTHNETVTHCCSPMAICAAGCILQAKLPSLDTQPPPGSPRLTILSASSVRTLVHCVVKYSRPPDLKSSSNVSLPFAWITGPRKRTQLSGMLLYLLHHRNSKLILHPAKFDNFKDEKNSDYYKIFFFFPNLIIDFKQELSPSKSLLYSTQLPILSPLIVSSIQGSYEK